METAASDRPMKGGSSRNRPVPDPDEGPCPERGRPMRTQALYVSPKTISPEDR